MRRGFARGVLELLRGVSALQSAAAPSWGMAAGASGMPAAPLLTLSAMYSRLAADATPCVLHSTRATVQGASSQLLVPEPSAAGAPPLQPRCGFATSAQQQGSLQQSQRRPPMGRAATAPPMQSGIVHVQATRNNTIFTLTDDAGNTKAWSSAGAMGFKNARKATSYAAEAAAEKLAADARRMGFGQVQLRVRGLGQGKQSSIKTLHAAGLVITSIHECTPLPHNGCRPKKKRRI